ncbi:D-alanyl-D-alanine carboxypeptidase family protein [Ammoniphilus sp. CFH 90114]|uniref:D-alanyl-D-alanine carboxypeptidase family protein n=1 Tax=Ammoniphilus sp. CFH 90114 TaxID=2493665 RepID=UPI001F0BA48F|nr:D-alanyl-D-alanine carboxypeptidase family protein [Ammoniphilus sp. CFH 90114]
MSSLVRFMSIMIVFLFLFPVTVWSSNQEELPINSEAVILIDATTGQVIYENRAKDRMYPASITKIVTGIMAIESGRLSELAVTSKRARWAEGTRIYLAQDEEKRIEDIVYGLLMHSGNDAGIVIAEHLGGTVEDFAIKMNEFVREKVGVYDSHFMNPHGLFDEQHYTTAYDMAMISRYAMQNPTFRTMVSTKKRPWHGEEWETNLVNHNKLLWRYEGATGIKNGYVNQSGNTLVASAKREGTELIAVALKASGSEKVYADTSTLLDYGFDHFETRRLFTKGKRFERSDGGSLWEAAEDVYYTVKKNESLSYRVDEEGNIVIGTGGVKQVLKGKLKIVESSGPKDEAANMMSSVRVHNMGNVENDGFISYLVGAVVLSILAVFILNKLRKKDNQSKNM